MLKCPFKNLENLMPDGVNLDRVFQDIKAKKIKGFLPFVSDGMGDLSVDFYKPAVTFPEMAVDSFPGCHVFRCQAEVPAKEQDIFLPVFVIMVPPYRAFIEAANVKVPDVARGRLDFVERI